MAVTVEFYNFAKRKNSTKVPASAGTDFDVALKAPCSWYNPVFLLYTTDMPTWNYASWGSWYYYVTDIISQGNNRFEIRCALDPLATYRDEIFNTAAFVMYDTAANTEIPDTRLSTITARTVATSSGQFLSIGRMSDPSACPVVLSIVGQDGLSYFAVDQSVAKDLLSSVHNVAIPNIFQNPGYTTVEEVLNSIGQIFASGNASRCVTAAKQIAATMGAATGMSKTIYLGDFDTGKTGIEITRRIYYDSMSISIPWQFADWRRRAPYTELYLYCPFFGLVALPTENLVGETVIDVEASLDMVSGSCLFIVFGHNSGYYIGSYSANLGGEYAIGTSGVTALTAATAIVGATVAGAAIIATGGAAGAMAAKLGGAAIAGVIGGNTPSASTISGGGGGAAMGLRAQSYIIAVTHNTNVDPASVGTVVGTPAMSVKTLSTVPGYVQTQAASVEAEAPEPILAAINSTLDGGVFIE